MPLSNSIFNVFGRSPIRPLQEHMAKVQVCTKEILPFFESVIAKQWSKAEAYQQKIVDLEREADTLKSELRLHLPKSLFLPVSRSDLLEVLATQDRIANRAKDIAGLIIGRQMEIPAKIAPAFIQLVRRCVDAAEQAQQAINELDELLETGFLGREVALVEDMIQELNQIENETDEIQIQVRKELFTIEQQIPPIDVMFLYKVIELCGEMADCAERVGKSLQLLLAR